MRLTVDVSVLFVLLTECSLHVAQNTMSRVLPSGIPDPEFRSNLILPGNDLIPTCVPPEHGNSAEYPEFRKMRTGINRNTNRNAHPTVDHGRISTYQINNKV